MISRELMVVNGTGPCPKSRTLPRAEASARSLRQVASERRIGGGRAQLACTRVDLPTHTRPLIDIRTFGCRGGKCKALCICLRGKRLVTGSSRREAAPMHRRWRQMTAICICTSATHACVTHHGWLCEFADVCSRCTRECAFDTQHAVRSDHEFGCSTLCTSGRRRRGSLSTGRWLTA